MDRTKSCTLTCMWFFGNVNFINRVFFFFFMNTNYFSIFQRAACLYLEICQVRIPFLNKCSWTLLYKIWLSIWILPIKVPISPTDVGKMLSLIKPYKRSATEQMLTACGENWYTNLTFFKIRSEHTLNFIKIIGVHKNLDYCSYHFQNTAYV